MKYIFCVLFLLIFTEYLHSQGFENELLVSDPKSGFNETAPFMQNGTDGTVYISFIRYTTSSSGDIYFTSSQDNGNTFSAPVKITNNGMVNGNYQRAARFVIDKNNTIHMVWMEAKLMSQPDVWYSQSNDKGKSWSHQKSLMDSDDSLIHSQDFCDIAVDSSNKLYVSFLDAREQQRNTSENLQLYLTTSSDGGATWSNNYKVSDMPSNEGGTCECCSQSIQVSKSGNIYIAFRTNINDRRDIFLARSLDGGMTFGKAFPIQNSPWTIPACPVTGPRIALDFNENLHITWFDDRDNAQPAVYYAFLPYGSTATPVNIRISDNSFTGINYPDVSVSAGGKIALAYQTFNENARYYFGDNPALNYSDFAISSDNSEKKFVSVFAKNDDEIYLCWQDMRRDAGDIYFKKIQINTSSVFESNSWMPADDLNEKILSQGNLDLNIYNLRGTLLVHKKIEVTGQSGFDKELNELLPATTGVYIINYTNGFGNYSKLFTIVK